MALAAGLLRDRIVIRRAVVETDDYGGEQQTWNDLAAVWAQVLYGRGQERREAAQTAASVPATFRVRQSGVTAGVTPKDRIRFESVDWNIVSNVPLGRDGREITAVRAA
jgi:SPP1 family predicted phage head-tail adaptor